MYAALILSSLVLFNYIKANFNNGNASKSSNFMHWEN